MEYQIRYSQFCSLAREHNFHVWLAKNNPDCYQELLDHLSFSTGCKSNAAKMKVIVDKLKSAGLFDNLIDFLKKHFPLTVTEEDSSNNVQSVIGDTVVVESINDKEVFSYYNPKLLTFPHKIILENDNPDVLKKDLMDFLIDKVSYDFVFIGNRVFVEYFHRKYSEESTKIDKKSREIFKYKLRKGLTHGQADQDNP